MGERTSKLFEERKTRLVCYTKNCIVVLLAPGTSFFSLGCWCFTCNNTLIEQHVDRFACHSPPASDFFVAFAYIEAWRKGGKKKQQQLAGETKQTHMHTALPNWSWEQTIVGRDNYHSQGSQMIRSAKQTQERGFRETNNTGAWNGSFAVKRKETYALQLEWISYVAQKWLAHPQWKGLVLY